MKKFLTLMPAIALMLVLTACNKLPQPAVPETPKSVEKAMQDAIAEDKEMTTDEETMEAGELSDEDVTLEIDATLDGLESDLDAALEVEVDVDPVTDVAPGVDTEPAQIEAAPIAGTEQNTVDEEPEPEEEEVIDEPIIIE